VVALSIQVEATGVTKEVLFFVLDSNKPLWKGELTDCGLVLGTNSLEDLGFKIFNMMGQQQILIILTRRKEPSYQRSHLQD